MPVPTALRLEVGEHVVHFHEDDDLGPVADHLRAAAADGDTIIVVATPAHRAVLLDGIGGSDRVMAVDAAATLDALLVDGRLDSGRFDDLVGSMVRDAVALGRPLRLYGEMVALLWDAGDVAAAIELELLWVALAETLPFSLVCGYARPDPDDEQAAESFTAVCSTHSGLVDGAPAPRAVDATRRFGATQHAPRLARRFVAEVLDEWGRVELVDDASLIVTELSTNAIRHVGSDVSVSLSRSGPSVMIWVGDGGVAPPVQRALTPDAHDGRGLHIVSRLSSRWGHGLAGTGKVVWAELGERHQR